MNKVIVVMNEERREYNVSLVLITASKECLRIVSTAGDVMDFTLSEIKQFYVY